jgi:hypothetical protein
MCQNAKRIQVVDRADSVPAVYLLLLASIPLPVPALCLFGYRLTPIDLFIPAKYKDCYLVYVLNELAGIIYSSFYAPFHPQSLVRIDLLLTFACTTPSRPTVADSSPSSSLSHRR